MNSLSVSILDSDFSHLSNVVDILNNSNADMIHCDVMDGVYVPNLTFGPPVIKCINSIAQKPLDVHLMIVNPDDYIQTYKDAGADWLTVHYEACTHLNKTIHHIKDLGMHPGVALNPHTSVQLLEDILPDLDLVLIMSVNPGYGSQKFIENSFNKIKKLKQMINDSGSSAKIQVDGGVCSNNIQQLKEAGVDIFVIGSAIFKSSDPAHAINSFKAL